MMSNLAYYNQELIAETPDRLDDVDGLPVINCDVQLTRVQHIIVEHKLIEEALKKELHTTRLALIKQVCTDHNAETDCIDDIGSLQVSVGGAGDHGDSDMSWEAVEQLGPAPTLWVPDHPVNRCMGCDTEFWSCGKIFCADCSDNFTPLPSEQLYNPVRICSDCFSELHHHTSSCQCNFRTKLAKYVDNEMDNSTIINNNVPSLCSRSRILIASKEASGCGEASLQANQQKRPQPTPKTSAVN